MCTNMGGRTNGAAKPQTTEESGERYQISINMQKAYPKLGSMFAKILTEEKGELNTLGYSHEDKKDIEFEFVREKGGTIRFDLPLKYLKIPKSVLDDLEVYQWYGMRQKKK